MWFLFLLILIGVFGYYYWKYHYNFRSLLKLPSPPNFNFFLGNALYFSGNIVDNFAALISIPAKFGPIVRVYLGPFRRTVVLTDPKDVEFFLSSSEHIVKSPGYDGFKPWLGNGLVNSAGDHWRKHRKIITPTFHFQTLERFVHYINSNSKELVEKLEENVCKAYDIYPIVNLYALDVICETAMNMRINAMNDGSIEYVNAVKIYLEIFLVRFFSLTMQHDVIFKFTKGYRLQQEAVKILKGFTESVIKKRREERKLAVKEEAISDNNSLGIKKRIAFLDLLLDLAEEEGLTDDEIREEVDTFMFAGHDTMSCAISFGLFELAKYPEIQERLYRESVEVLGDVNSEEFTFRNVQDLKYLDMVVKECLRINAPVPFVERLLMRNVELNGVSYPKDTIISFLPYAMHRNADLYPDPLKFDPDRFLPENCIKRHPYSYIPFSAGPRNCIGQRFAVLETKATIIKIIRHFKLTPVVPEHIMKIGNDAILKSVNGVPVVLSSRK